jgi:hypothetical protein
VGKEAFLKKSSSDQKAYLERFPKSTHRFLIKTKRSKNKDEYESLTEKGKALYDEANPTSKHKAKFKPTKKSFDSIKDFGESFRDYKAAKSKKFHAAKEQRDSLQVSGAGLITKEQVRSVSHLKPEHLHMGAANIENNREEIHDIVDKQLAIYPEFKERGLAAVRDILQGDNVFNPKSPEKDADFTEEEYATADKETKSRKGKKGIIRRTYGKVKKAVKKKIKRTLNDSKKQKDGKSMLTTIIKYSLIGAGIGLLVLSAGPLSMIIGRAMLELSRDFRSLASDEDEDYRTVNDVITMTADYLRHVDLEDLKYTSKKAFAALAGSRFALRGIYEELSPVATFDAEGNADLSCPYDILADNVTDYLYSNGLVDSVSERQGNLRFSCNSNADHQYVTLTHYPKLGTVKLELGDAYSEKAPDPSSDRAHTTSIRKVHSIR